MTEDQGAIPPTAAAGPMTVLPLPFVTGSAGFGTVVVACRWAAPWDGDPRLILTRLAAAVFVGIFLLSFFCGAGLRRSALAALPFWVVLVVHGIAAYLAGSWPGGWVLGAAGAALGAAAGAATGRLLVWAVVGGINRLGTIGVIGGWSGGGRRGVAGAAAWAVVGAAVGAAAGFLTLALLSRE
jgi:hypothetical protein